MLDFCGAWTSSGTPIAQRLDIQDRALIKSRLAGAQGFSESAEGPLWIASSPESRVSDGASCLAAAGFIAFEGGGRSGLEGLLKTVRDRGAIEPLVPGQYVLAHADFEAETLSLHRDISGGERLFYVRRGDLCLFSTSVHALLARTGFSRRMDPETAAEFVLSGGIAFGNRTLFDGIEELAPGETLVLARSGFSRRNFWRELPPSPRQSPPDEPKLLWRLFVDAVSLAIGTDRKVAVSLSGGLDSSIIAACAVEIVGAANVRAFTWEYDEPAHPSETWLASSVASRLGIQHDVMRVTYEDCLRAMPEVLWRTEHPDRVSSLLVASLAGARIRESGCHKILTGGGFEQPRRFFYHDWHAHRWARGLEGLPSRDLLLRGWISSSFGQEFPFTRRCLLDAYTKLVRLLRPDLSPPRDELHHPMLALLRHNGLLADMASFYPDSLGPLARWTEKTDRISEAIGDIRDLPLLVQMRLIANRIVTVPSASLGRHKIFRDMGVHLAAPSYFLYGMPWGRYFSWRPDNDVPRDERVVLSESRRPLLRETLRSRLPEEVVEHRKRHLMGFPRSWRGRIPRDLSLKLSAAFKHGPPFSEVEWETVVRLFPRAAMLGLWHRLFMESQPRSAPPKWEDL